MIITNIDWLQFVINILCGVAFFVVGCKFNSQDVEIKNLKNDIKLLQNYIEHLPRQK